MDATELREKEARIKIVRDFKDLHWKQWSARLGSENARRAWSDGRATSARPLEELRVNTERLLADKDRVKQLLLDEGLYHPIVLHHADGTEARFDPMDSLQNEELHSPVTDFLNEATKAMEARLPSFAERFGIEMKDELTELKQKVSPASESSKSLEELGELVKKATPEDWEPLAAKARLEIAKLAKRIESLEKRLAAPKTKTIWQKSPWLAPSMVLGLLGIALTALAFYIDARVESKLREVGLLVVRDNDNHRSEPEKQQTQQQPAHAATPLPSASLSAPVVPTSSASP